VLNFKPITTKKKKKKERKKRKIKGILFYDIRKLHEIQIPVSLHEYSIGIIIGKESVIYLCSMAAFVL
jgi:hypothetical protein